MAVAGDGKQVAAGVAVSRMCGAKKKGSYRVTKTGNAVIAEMNKIERIIAGGALCKPLD